MKKRQSSSTKIQDTNPAGTIDLENENRIRRNPEGRAGETATTTGRGRSFYRGGQIDTDSQESEEESA